MKIEGSGDNLSSLTLFVRGIPASCSNEDLSEVFSQAGPVKDSFVVKYKSREEKEGPTRPCIGYVTYVSPDDAKVATRKNFTIDGEQLRVSFAKKKKFSKKNTKDTFEIVKSDGSNEKVNKPVVETPLTQESSQEEEGKGEYDDSFTVLLCGLPGLYKKEHALSLWKKCGLKEPINIIIPCRTKEEELKPEEESKKEGKGLLQNAKFIVETKQAALKACNKLAGKTIGRKGNYTLKAILLTPEGDFKAARRSRLIVRNVSFQCSENDLRKAFDLFGTITEVKIPTKPNGQKRGFAFVQFSHVFEAARAIQAMNMKEIKGRKVAIDWSLPKEKYAEMNSSAEVSKEVDNTVKDEKSEEPKIEESHEDEESSENDEETSDDSGLEEDDDEGERSERDKETNSEEESGSDEEESEEEDESENVYEEPLNKAAKIAKKKLDKKSSHDVHEGRTVFVLNLSYDSTEEQLAEVLSEYGELNYTKIVVNRDTGMSKGCAFAQFSALEDAEKCIECLGEENSGVMLDGRQIRVVKALNRGDAEKMRKDEKKKPEKEDKRNLYLGREGMVRPGTQAAEGLSQIEMRKRDKIENAKRAKLKNPNIFVSQTRLCIHNLPRSIDEAKLREIFFKYLKGKKGIRITECRIMRDLKNLNEKGVGRSLGYAFVDFAKHETALKALRTVNNNPDVFDPIKRPIVEFALENKKALEMKEQRRKRFVAKNKLREKIQDSTVPWENKNPQKKKIGRRERQKRKMQTGGNPPGEKRQKIDEKSEVTLFKERGEKRQKIIQKGASKETGQKKREGNSERIIQRGNSERIIQRGNSERVNRERDPEERKSYQGSTGTTLSGKKLPLPAHAGPKIRQKNRGKILEQMRKSKKLNSKAARDKLTRNYHERQKNDIGGARNFPKPAKQDVKFQKGDSRRKKRGGEDMDFNALVAKYTKAIMAKTPKMEKSGVKWFEE